MLKYILKKILQGIPVLFGVVLVVFIIFHVLPGDPVKLMTGQRSDVSTQEAITKELGLDQPTAYQFAYYLNDLSPISVHKDTPDNQKKYNYISLFGVGNEKILVLKSPYLRRSFQSGKKVNVMIAEHLSGTLILALAAMLIASFFGILFGTIAALNQNRLTDHFLVTLSIFGISTPSFISAVLIALVFGFYLSDYTGLSMTGRLWEYDPFEGERLVLANLILPAITLGIRPLAIITQMTRSSMLDVMGQDYIRTAQAKGLGLWQIVTRHALRNAMNPVITAVSGWLASLMAGAFFVEYVFNWKGIGFMTINAVETLDFPVVAGAVLVIAVIFIGVNILTDIVYRLTDPRVRLR